MKRFMRTLITPATCCMLLPARRSIQFFPQQYPWVTRPSRMPFMWQQARNVSTTTNHSSATDGVIADQIAQVEHWVKAFPWLLEYDADLTPEEIQRRLKSWFSSGEGGAPKIHVDEDGSFRLSMFVRTFGTTKKSYTPGHLEQLVFRQFKNIFAQHFDQKPINLDSCLQDKRFDGKTPWFTTGPNGGHICGSTTKVDDHHISSVVERLQKAFKMRSFIHVDDHQLKPKAKRVMVVSGESGSGKTHAALTSNKEGVTIYLSLDQSLTLDNARTGLPHLGDDKRMACVNAIVKRCVAALPRHRNLDYLRGVPLHIVLDELGNQPNRLRVVILHREEIVNALAAQNYGWDADKIRIMCVGTGVARSETLISSKPNSFDIKTIGPSSLNRSDRKDINVLTTMFGIIRSSQRRLEQEAVAAFSQHPYIAPLLDNYRAAAILTSHVIAVFDNLHDDGPQMVALMSTVEYALFYVSQQFKSLNGLSRLSIDQVMHQCGLGLRKALCGPTLADYAESRLNNKTTGRNNEEAKLVCDYGILTERVEDMMKVEQQMKDLEAIGATTSSELKERAKPDLARLLKLPRYCMSRAVGNMMLSNFGLSTPPVSAQSGEGLEFAIAAKLVLMMRCFRRVEEVKRHLMPNGGGKPPPATASESSLAESLAANLAQTETLPTFDGRGGVVLWELPHRLGRGNISKESEKKQTSKDHMSKTKGDGEETSTKVEPPFSTTPKGKFCLDIMRSVNSSLAEGRAVVLVNAKGAPHADVILVAKGLVCLVQCKQTDDYEVDTEVTKMLTMPQNDEITECLCQIAGIKRDEIAIILATSVTTTKDSPLCHTSRPSQLPHEDLLFPLVWPTTPTAEKMKQICSSVILMNE